LLPSFYGIFKKEEYLMNKIKKLIPFLKGAVKSKTIHANVYILVAAVFGVYLFPELVPFLNNIAIALTAGINIYLRTITVNSLVEKSRSKEDEFLKNAA